MQYGFKTPANVSWGLAGTTSPAFETDVRLSNGQPSEQTAISSIASSSPNITEYFDITADWTVPQGINAVCMLNLSCPENTLIEVTGRRVGDGDYTRNLGGNSESRTMRLPDGRVQLIILTEVTETDYIGLQFRIYNDAGGVTWADDDSYILLGELRAYQTTTLCDAPRRDRDRSTRRSIERASNAAVHIIERGEYRMLNLQITASITETYKKGLDGSVDIETLRIMQDAYKYRVLALPRGVGIGRDPVDYGLLNRTALFAIALWGKSQEETYPNGTSTPLDLEEAV